MSVLKTAKSRMTKTSNQERAYFAEVRKLDHPFTFPTTKEQLSQYILTERSKLLEAQITLANLMKSVESAVQAAWKLVDEYEDVENPTLKTEMEEYLEKNTFIDHEITASGFMTRIEFRLRELEEQGKFIPNDSDQSTTTALTGNTPTPVSEERTLKMPKIEIPEFSGDIRMFGSFWTTFQALVHDNDKTAKLEKFLYLKQSLKGGASKAIASLPVIDENYDKAIALLKSRYERGSCMTDLLISDISKIRPAGHEPAQCRIVLDILMNKLTALECQGIKLDDSPLWRGIILSKFPFEINKQVLTEEKDNAEAYTASSLLSSISEIIALNESIEITTQAHRESTDRTDRSRPSKFHRDITNGNKDRKRENYNFNRFPNNNSKRDHQASSFRVQCVCGEPGHSPFKCHKFTSVNARRQELKRMNACWSCFEKGHSSQQCTKMNKCPACGDTHHSSVCFEKEKNQNNNLPLVQKSKPWERKSRNDSTAMKPETGVKPNRSYTTQNVDDHTETVSTTQSARPRTESNGKYQVVLMTATALAFNEKERDYEPVTIFIDSGAQRSFITSELSDMLKLPIKANREFSVSGIGEVVTKFTSDEVGITLKSPTSGVKLRDVLIYTKPKLTAPIETAVLSKKDKRFIKSRDICIAHPSLQQTSVRPTILIGQDLLARIVDTAKPAITLPSGLQLTPTVFGYAISGRGTVDENSSDEESCTEYSALEVIAPVINEAFEEYKKNIKNLYEIESLGIKTGKDENDEAIMKFMKDYRSTIEIKNNTATAGFPFTESAKSLKDNYNVAFKRLEHLMRELRKDPEKMVLYDKTLEEYVKQGIIEEVTHDVTDGDYVFYLPHRHVWTPTKSTQLRIVFDASSHARGEVSLNQVIYEGYSLTSLIHEILMNFRCPDLVMISDIAKAFLQVRLPIEHRDATRFLWSQDLTKEPGGSNLKVFRFARVPFGINASPAILNQVILKHLESNPSETNAEIAKTLYVDNVLLSGSSESEMIEKYRSSKATFNEIGMNLRDYLSNSARVNEEIPEVDRAKKSTTSVLGMMWDSAKDTFTLKSSKKTHKKISKRTVLSQINGLCYDPLGLLTPLLVKAKVFLQDLHKEQLSWDQQLSDELTNRWKVIEEEMLGFTYEVPRKITETENVASRTMSVFVDSSKRMYACALYVTTTMNNGKSTTVLYTAKSKVSPMKKELTIPRLELLAIHIGLTLVENAIEHSGLRIDRVDVFSDSTIALAWVKLEKRLPSVAMMIAQKIQLSKARLQTDREVHFHYVPTDENIADVATRGLTQSEAIGHTWWNGPKWLNEPIEAWPVRNMKYEDDINDEDVEAIMTAITAAPAKIAKTKKKSQKAITVSKDKPKQIIFGSSNIWFGEPTWKRNMYLHKTPIEKVWPTEKFSDLNKLKRVVSYALRFVGRCRETVIRNRERKIQLNRLQNHVCEDDQCTYCWQYIQDSSEETGKVTASEMIRAEKYLLRQEQHLVDLVPMLKSINDDNVRYDDDGIIRKFSRLSDSDLSRSAKAPAYLPRKSTLAKLILKNIHEVNAHCGAQQLTCEMRQKYWLPHDRAMSKRIVRECTICRRHNGLPFRHPMSGPIPEERVKAAPPFAHTGVDLMGPFTVKESGSDVKRWVALYTCLVTRLIHLEVVTDLSAKAFLMTLKRFIARRGCPEKMISDNGTNFRLTAMILEQGSQYPVVDDGVTESVSTYLATHGIDWHFIPPASPWMGGAWERLVGIVKRSFTKAIGKRKLDLETLQTVMCEVEAITNSRPLTHVGEHGCEVLRPVDFIHKDVKYGQGWQERDSDGDDTYSEKVEFTSHKEAKAAIDYAEKFGERYWNLWKTEYLLELRERQNGLSIKNRSTNAPPRVGEIVIVDENDDSPRGEWRLARIVQLVKSRDDQIRSALIRFASGREVQRPVVRLVPLEIRVETESDQSGTTDSDPPIATNEELPTQGAQTRPKRLAKTVAIERNKGIDLSSLAMMLTVVCCLTLPTAVNSQVLKCIKGGVTINAFKAVSNLSVESELCTNYGSCVKLLSQPIQVDYQIPIAQSIHDYKIQWRAIVNGFQTSESITCQGHMVCELIDCFLCSELVGNPHCWPKAAIATIMLSLYLVLTIIIIVWKVCIGKYITSVCRKITQKTGAKLLRTSRRLRRSDHRRVTSDSDDEEDIPLIRTNTRAERSRFVTIIAIMCVLVVSIGSSTACQITHVINSNQVLCTDNGSNQSHCTSMNEKTISMSNHRQEVCLRTKTDNRITGQIRLRFHHIKMTCNPVVKYFTRNVQLQTVSVKRCPQAGSCSADRCSEVTSGSYIPELNETYKFPGIARCSESCGGIYCGCLLPTSGCLFSRTYVKAQDDIVYRMVSCPTWQESLVLTMERLYNNGTQTERKLILRPEVPIQIMNATLTVDWINTPNIPILSSSVLQGVGNYSDIAMIVSDKEETAIVCPSVKAAKAMATCHVPDLCQCQATESVETCNCRDMNMSAYLNSLENRLPLSSETVNLVIETGKITAYSHKSIAELYISNFEFTNDIVVHNDSCKLQLGEAKGCFNCISGASFTANCQSVRPRTATVSCGDIQFVTMCGPETVAMTVNVHMTQARVEEQCKVDCMHTTDPIFLQGTLAYHSMWVDKENVNKQGTFISLINIPDISHVFSVMRDWWKMSLAAAVCVIIAIGVTVLLGPTIVQWVLFRILRGSKAKRK